MELLFTSGETFTDVEFPATSSGLTTSDPSALGDRNALVAGENLLNILYFVIGALGLAGNGLVIAVILNVSLMRKQVTNTYIINQSCVDAAASVFLILTTCFQDNGRVLSPDSLADRFYCVWWLTKSPLWGIMLSSSLNLIAITLERYVAVVHPIAYKAAYSRPRVLASIAVIWILGPVFNMIYSGPATVVQNGGCNVFGNWPSLTANRVAGIYLFTLQYVIPAAMFIYCYIKIALALRSRLTVGGQKETAMKKARRNITVTLGVVNLSFMICWGINQIYFFMFNVGYPMDFQGAFYHFTVILLYCNCCVNPFIYIIQYDQFKRAVKRLVFRKKISVAPEEEMTESVGTKETQASGVRSSTTQPSG